MMHNRCSSSHNMVGPCSCGLFHTQSNSSLSMLFSSMPTSVHKPTAADENYDPYSSYPNSYAYPYPYAAATSVDCTLSLGTPSTRMSEDSAVDGDGRRSRGGGNGGSGGGQERRSSISNFCWDILGQSKHAPSSQSQKGAARGGGSNSSSGSSSCSGDPLLARRCANCDTTSTPLWRNGPRGPKSLCNACGIRFKKEERRASAAAASANTGPSGGGGGGMESQQLYSHHNHYSSWGAAQAAPQQKVPCYGNEFRFIDDDGRDSDNGISFLSWRLNVTDRPSGLVHDFTR